MTAAAMLDPDAGRITGFVAGADGAPGRARIFLGGALAHEVLALSPITALGAGALAKLGPPPSAFCAFSARLPADLLTKADDGTELQVLTQSGDTILTQRIASRAELARYVEGCVMADSADLKIARLEAGVFSGELILAGGGTAPRVTLNMKGEEIGAATLSPKRDGVYALSAALPRSALGDGVTVVEFRIGEETLARYPISAGEALAGDLVAEIASLRAELDQLKKTFRETMAGGVIARDERPMILAELLTHVDNLFEARDRVRRIDAIEGDLEDDDWDLRE